LSDGALVGIVSGGLEEGGNSRGRVAAVGIVRKRVEEDGRVTVGADREGIVGVCVCVCDVRI
jgi:hypothetical protein